VKIAIVGSEEHTRHLAPFDDPDYKIWVFNEAANAEWCKRWDLCFQIHPPNIYRNNNKKDPEHWNWLRQPHGKRIVLQEVDPEIPDSEAFPLKKINENYLSSLTWEGERLKNFKATISYAIALALYEGAEEIHIYGIELVHTAEYRRQQANFSFWTGVAVGRKIKVVLHCSRGTFDGALYGYEDYMETGKLESYLVGLKEQRELTLKQLNMIEGAIQLASQLLEEEKEKDDEKATPGE